MKTLVILAAGMGSRFGGLKQVEPVGPAGETIMDYSVYDALRAGFDKLVFIVRQDTRDLFRETIGKRFEKRLMVDYVIQELDRLPPGFTVSAGRKKPWGTGHAVLMAAGAVQEPFAVINADDFYGRTSFLLLGEHLDAVTPDYAMVGFVLRNTLSEFGTVARGACTTSNGYLTEVTELTTIESDGDRAKYTDEQGSVHSLTGEELVSMNMWGFTPAFFEQVGRLMIEFLEKHARDEKQEFYIPSAVNLLLGRQLARVRMLRTSDSWFGMTYRQDRPKVIEGLRLLIQQGAYPEQLWS